MSLTQSDVKTIREMIKDQFEEDFGKFKNEFFNRLDAFLFEVQGYRNEQDVTSQRVSTLEDRVEKVEKKVFRSN